MAQSWVEEISLKLLICLPKTQEPMATFKLATSKFINVFTRNHDVIAITILYL